MPKGIPRSGRRPPGRQKGYKIQKVVSHRVEGTKLILEIELTKFVKQAITAVMAELEGGPKVPPPEEWNPTQGFEEHMAEEESR